MIRFSLMFLIFSTLSKNLLIYKKDKPTEISFEYQWNSEESFGVPFWYYQGYNFPYWHDYPFDWTWSTW